MIAAPPTVNPDCALTTDAFGHGPPRSPPAGPDGAPPPPPPPVTTTGNCWESTSKARRICGSWMPPSPSGRVTSEPDRPHPQLAVARRDGPRTRLELHADRVRAGRGLDHGRTPPPRAGIGVVGPQPHELAGRRYRTRAARRGAAGQPSRM